jgi:hypothetical protein
MLILSEHYFQKKVITGNAVFFEDGLGSAVCNDWALVFQLERLLNELRQPDSPTAFILKLFHNYSINSFETRNSLATAS